MKEGRTLPRPRGETLWLRAHGRLSERLVRGLTEGGLGGGGPLHARAVVGHVVVGAGAHRPAGAEQAQPLALLPVARVGGHWREGEKEREMEGERETSLYLPLYPHFALMVDFLDRRCPIFFCAFLL